MHAMMAGAAEHMSIIRRIFRRLINGRRVWMDSNLASHTMQLCAGALGSQSALHKVIQRLTYPFRRVKFIDRYHRRFYTLSPFSPLFVALRIRSYRIRPWYKLPTNSVTREQLKSDRQAQRKVAVSNATQSTPHKHKNGQAHFFGGSGSEWDAQWRP